MGQAKRKKDLIGFSPKKKRFVDLLRKITNKYNEYEIQRFASIRFDRKEEMKNWRIIISCQIKIMYVTSAAKM